MAPSVSPWYDPRRASTSGGPFRGGSPARTSLRAAPDADSQKSIVSSAGGFIRLPVHVGRTEHETPS